MDQETIPNNYDDDLEEGLCSDSSVESYTPLPRPEVAMTKVRTKTSTKMDDDYDGDDKQQQSNVNEEVDSNSPNETSSSSDESSDNCLKKLTRPNKTKSRKRVKRTVLVRVESDCVNNDSASDKLKKARFKRYDVWTAALQEDALTETMRGCDVTQNRNNDRNVENYDFSLRCRLNGDYHPLKRRRQSHSADEQTDDDPYHNDLKRARHSSSRPDLLDQRRQPRERLGKRFHKQLRRGSSTTSGSDSNSYEARHIEDVKEETTCDGIELAQDMATKLQEEKAELLVRIIEVLGKELPLQIFKETQRIEAEGGMIIKNGKRRRTPGGVFLFLLKHHDTVSDEDKKAIFGGDRQKTQKQQKEMQSLMRQRKVEELKKCLSEQGAELPTFSTRKEPMLLGDDSDDQQKPPDGNLSNPPPSPEVVEQSPDYKSLAINHVSSEEGSIGIDSKPSTSHDAGFSSCNSKELQSYDDDFLDVNCGDIDFF